MLNLHNVKLTYKRTLVRLSIITLLASGVILPAPIPSPLPLTEVEAQDCQPSGTPIVGPYTGSYDWIANGIPLSDSCWSHSPERVVFVEGVNDCGPFATPRNAWQFYYAGVLSQSFTIPSDQTRQNFIIGYEVDFIDPNNDGAWNRLEMEVWDMTTATLLAYDSFNGSMGDLYCSRRTQSWNRNLAGHTVLVRFKGSTAYPNSTFIRVKGIQLNQF